MLSIEIINFQVKTCRTLKIQDNNALQNDQSLFETTLTRNERDMSKCAKLTITLPVH